jgi:threonine/homoserine/homoserine lactone efflux protein
LLLTLIYQTFVIVLLLTFSFGPAFFALINTGIRYQFKTGSLLAVGIVASDFVVCLLIILLVNLGATNLIQDDKTQRFMGIVAGIVLLVYGALHFKEPAPSKSDETLVISDPSSRSMLMKGFLLNSLNPAVWLLWLGNVTAVSKTLDYSVLKMVLYFSLTLGLVLLAEFSKISAANKLKQILTQKIMHLINIITGSLLVIFGMVLIYNFYFER